MSILLTVTALHLHVAALPSADTLPAFDSPSTRELVERVIRESGRLPDDLVDYTVVVRSVMDYGVAADDWWLRGEEVFVAEDLVSDVWWHRDDFLQQRVRGHRMWLAFPFPATPGSRATEPWVIPHFYGETLPIPHWPGEGRQAERHQRLAINPFGEEGPEYYSFSAGDTLRISMLEDTVTVAEVKVRPRRAPPRGQHLVAGSFLIDLDRDAVAQARFGFVTGGPGAPLIERLLEMGIFVEVQNGLWEGRFWLPYEQRWDIHYDVFLLRIEGTLGLRVLSTFREYRINTGREPEEAWRAGLQRAGTDPGAFRDWPTDDVLRAREHAFSDFDDLRRLAAHSGTAAAPYGLRVRPHWARPAHLARYNRVEGLFLGAGVLMEHGDLERPTRDLYASAGWAFTEGTARGEVRGRWRPAAPVPLRRRLEFSAGAYRRLADSRTFRLSVDSDITLLFQGAFQGSDVRDYYEASGVEVRAQVGEERRGWTALVGARRERHEPVTLNTERRLFGAARDFPPLAGIEPGRHTALETELRYTAGSGAGGVTRGRIARLRGELGVGDFRFARATAFLSLRSGLGPFILYGELDAGHVAGDAPSQFLFRFGREEGLEAYGPGEFGGSTAALVRARLLLPLPPKSREPLASYRRVLVPPLRPGAVVGIGAGWSTVSEDADAWLERTGAVPTNGLRGSVLAGFSIFEDTLELVWAHPLGSDGAGSLRVGVVVRP